MRPRRAALAHRCARAARRRAAARPDAEAARQEAEREAQAGSEPFDRRPSFSMGASHVAFLDALAWEAGPPAPSAT
jgi:hypothetical protein